MRGRCVANWLQSTSSRSHARPLPSASTTRWGWQPSCWIIFGTQLLDEIRSAAAEGALPGIAPPEQSCNKERRTAEHQRSSLHPTSNAPSLRPIGVAPLDLTRPKRRVQRRVAGQHQWHRQATASPRRNPETTLRTHPHSQQSPAPSVKVETCPSAAATQQRPSAATVRGSGQSCRALL